MLWRCKPEVLQQTAAITASSAIARFSTRLGRLERGGDPSDLGSVGTARGRASSEQTSIAEAERLPDLPPLNVLEGARFRAVEVALVHGQYAKPRSRSSHRQCDSISRALTTSPCKVRNALQPRGTSTTTNGAHRPAP